MSGRTPLELPLRTERLVLREQVAGDLEALLAYHSRADVYRYLPGDPWTRERADDEVAKRFGRTHITERGQGLRLGVEHDGVLIGDISMWAADDTLSRCEIGWVFHPDHGGRGYATEAATAVLDLAFGHFGIHRVFAQLDPRNEASVRMCERLGMRKEAHLREDWYDDGEWTDNAIFGVLAQEHAQRASSERPAGSPGQTGFMADFNDNVIAEFRANHGTVGGPFEGATLLLLHSTGARSGAERVHPLVYRADGENYLIFASKAGAPEHPAWYHNVKAHPDASIEVGDDTVAVRAEELVGAERDEAYAAQAADYSGFADYQAKTDRVIPVVRLVPAG